MREVYLHDDENGGKDARESNPGQNREFSERWDAREETRCDCGDGCPNDGAAFSVGEDFEAL